MKKAEFTISFIIKVVLFLFVFTLFTSRAYALEVSGPLADEYSKVSPAMKEKIEQDGYTVITGSRETMKQMSGLDLSMQGMTMWPQNVIVIRNDIAVKSPCVLLHELGHAYDIGTDGNGIPVCLYSTTPVFQSIYEQESPSLYRCPGLPLKVTSCRNSYEYFAECVMFIYYSRESAESLKANCPLTFDYITSVTGYTI